MPTLGRFHFPNRPTVAPPGAGAMRSPDDIEAMFGRIVRNYDTMNRLMTGGRDGAWRRVVARQAVLGGRDGSVLDIATGTGDLAFALALAGAHQVTAVDFSQPMLDVADRKLAQRRAAVDQDLPITFIHADAMRLPFDDDGYDAVTVAFGIRNMPDTQAALNEMVRVLRPGGRWVCLELTPFRVPVLRAGFGLYFQRVVPMVGGMLSGDREAYRYLPKSAQRFLTAPELLSAMQRAGLVNTRYRLFGGGTVAMHMGEKSWPGA